MSVILWSHSQHFIPPQLVNPHMFFLCFIFLDPRCFCSRYHCWESKERQSPDSWEMWSCYYFWKTVQICKADFAIHPFLTKKCMNRRPTFLHLWKRICLVICRILELNDSFLFVIPRKGRSWLTMHIIAIYGSLRIHDEVLAVVNLYLAK